MTRQIGIVAGAGFEAFTTHLCATKVTARPVLVNEKAAIFGNPCWMAINSSWLITSSRLRKPFGAAFRSDIDPTARARPDG